MRYFVLLGVVLAAALGYTGYWFYLAGQIPERLDDWAAQRRAQGWTVSYEAVQVGGFPFRIEAWIDAPRVAQPRHPAAPRWEGTRIGAVAHPWNPTHVLFSFEGRQRLAATERNKRRVVDITAASNAGSYRAATDGRPRQLSLEAEGLTLVGPDLPGPATINRAILHVRRAETADRVGEAALKIEGLRLPAGIDAPLGRDVALLNVILGLTGPAANGLSTPDAVIAWRDGGGALEVQKLDLTWGEVQAEAAGTLTLDETTRPAGSMTARIRGHDALLDAAAASGRMRVRDRDLAKSVLGLLAAASGGILSVPVSLRNGQAFLGPVAIGRLRPLIPDDVRNRAPRSPARRQ